MVRLGHCLALLPVFRPDKHSLVADDDSICVWVLSDGLPKGGLSRHIDDGHCQLLVHRVVASQLFVVNATDGTLILNLKLCPCVHEGCQHRILAIRVQNGACASALFVYEHEETDDFAGIKLPV